MGVASAGSLDDAVRFTSRIGCQPTRLHRMGGLRLRELYRLAADIIHPYNDTPSME